MLWSMDDSRARRAEERRRRGTLRKTGLARVEVDLAPVRGGEAISLVTRLARESWSLTGRAFPAYPRSQIPVRFVSRREP